jgi:hypothetical protein
MNGNENPASRANAGSRANFKSEQNQNKASAGDWDAEVVAVWLARRLSMPSALAGVVAALASFGRVLQ